MSFLPCLCTFWALLLEMLLPHFHTEMSSTSTYFSISRSNSCLCNAVELIVSTQDSQIHLDIFQSCFPKKIRHCLLLL
jgi:hypothetical protein